MRELPVPAHFDPDRVGEVWRVPYTDEADAAFERYVAAGMHVVRSTTPIEQWPTFATSS
jgi:hypothetical protein